MKYRRRSGIIDRVFDLVTVTSADHLDGNKKQLQSGDPDGVGHNTLWAKAFCGRVSIGHEVLGEHLHVALEIIGQHHDLEKCVVIFELGRRQHVQAFALGFTDQILDISALVVFKNHLVGGTSQAGAENPVGVIIVFEQQALLRLTQRALFFSGKAHDH